MKLIASCCRTPWVRRAGHLPQEVTGGANRRRLHPDVGRRHPHVSMFEYPSDRWLKAVVKIGIPARTSRHIDNLASDSVISQHRAAELRGGPLCGGAALGARARA